MPDDPFIRTSSPNSLYVARPKIQSLLCPGRRSRCKNYHAELITTTQQARVQAGLGFTGGVFWGRVTSLGGLASWESGGYGGSKSLKESG